jgi:DNA polymerase-1
MEPGRRGEYLAWGHPGKNNTTEAKARQRLARIWHGDRPMVFHNAKFDLEVASEHLNLPIPPVERMHDSMIASFLADPYARDLGLKPMAEKHLGMPATERDELKAWILANVPEARQKQKEWGGYISLAPGDLVGKYAAGDVERTTPLWKKFRPQITAMSAAYRRELLLIPAIIETEREGMTVDTDRLRRDVRMYSDVLLKIDAWIRGRLGAPALNIDERESLAAAIDKAGLAENGWVLTATGKRSTKKGSLEAAVSDTLLVAALSYRGSLATCLRTFMEPWLRSAEDNEGLVFTQWHSTRGDTDHGARTGRLSSTPNLQNIPTEFEKIMPLLLAAGLFKKLKWLPQLPQVRSYVVADTKDHVLFGRDYDGQELRVLAHFEDGALRRLYEDNPKADVHQFIADELNRQFGLGVTRKVAKTLNFLKIYGGGAPKLAATLSIDVPKAQNIINSYMALLPGLKDLTQEMKRRERADEPIKTLGGRLYHAEPPRIVKGVWRNFGYKLLNYLVQGSSADMTKEAWLRYRAARRDSRLVLTVHDEIVGCAPKGHWSREMKVLKEAMESVELDVPLLSDGEYGYRWTEMKECA